MAQAQAKCWVIFLKKETGYFQKTIWSQKIKKEDTTIDTPKPPLKEESKMGEQASSQKEEKCGWGPNCPFCKAQKKDGEDQQQQKPLPKPQAKRPDTLSLTKMRQQWEEEMERLNTKYNLDCFSDSKLDS